MFIASMNLPLSNQPFSPTILTNLSSMKQSRMFGRSSCCSLLAITASFFPTPTAPIAMPPPPMVPNVSSTIGIKGSPTISFHIAAFTASAPGSPSFLQSPRQNKNRSPASLLSLLRYPIKSSFLTPRFKKFLAIAGLKVCSLTPPTTSISLPTTAGTLNIENMPLKNTPALSLSSISLLSNTPFLMVQKPLVLVRYKSSFASSW
mmetsp:Transcript_1036/g.1838  ORF Transcript_1036/g.1838 Transcript_1036/m.1838 type:complete len:204 (-) Transcript_1036:9162-9773(-)